MATFEAKEAAAITHGVWMEWMPSEPLRTFAIDTRLMEAGQVFVAIRTERRDGHAYLEEARQRGALAAVVSEPCHEVGLPQLVVEDPVRALQSLARIWRQRFKGPVIGISGSFGKTTVRELLGRALGSLWCRTKGNFNNFIGVPLTLLELEPRYYAGGIIEAGINEAGERALLADLIDPDLALITGVGPAHLEKLGTVAHVAKEKAMLPKAVRPGGRVVIPQALLAYPDFHDFGEDVALDLVAVEGRPVPLAVPCGARVVTFQWEETGGAAGMGRLYRVEEPSKEVTFCAGSEGMVMNLALVVHTALELGVPLGSLQAALDGWRPFHRRGEIFRFGDRVYYVDCYNANPVSMMDSFQRFKKVFAESDQLYVFGGMEELGENAAHWHRETMRQMPLPPGARALLIGRWGEAMRDGLLEAGCDDGQVAVHAGALDVRDEIQQFAGAVFLKGSRAYALERLLEEGAVRC